MGYDRERKQRRIDSAYRRQDAAARTLDDLAMMDKLKEEFLPKLIADLANGLTDKEILQKYKQLAAARLVTNVVMETDSAKATSAAKEILDRSTGKPKETREVRHKYGQLTDEELDALLKSEEEDI